MLLSLLVNFFARMWMVHFFTTPFCCTKIAHYVDGVCIFSDKYFKISGISVFPMCRILHPILCMVHVFLSLASLLYPNHPFVASEASRTLVTCVLLQYVNCLNKEWWWWWWWWCKWTINSHYVETGSRLACSCILYVTAWLTVDDGRWHR